MIELKMGDLLLFPTDKTCPVYQFMDNKLGKFFADLLKNMTNHQFAHVGMYLVPSTNKNKFWSLEAVDTGVWLIERNVKDLQYLTVVRNTKLDKNTREDLQKLVFNYWNTPYDWTSLLLNGLTELAGIVGLEEYLEKTFNEVRDTPHNVICSELIARMFSEIGLSFVDNEEYTSPMDIYENVNFKVIIDNNK